MPVYEHDCRSCEFLETFEVPDCEIFDLYFCARCDEGTIVMRYDNEGRDYASYPSYVWKQLRESIQRRSVPRDAAFERAYQLIIALHPAMKRE